ncbi:MAG: hypothetical protein IH961_04770 [Chloroflexi bacterium]|nr:hypothetical protein [Chloroflexota bacterium]
MWARGRARDWRETSGIGTPGNEIADAPHVTSAATSGSTTLTLTLAPKELTIDDLAHVSVELVSEPGITVHVDDRAGAVS